MNKKIKSIEEYKRISGDVWTIFKKYYPAEASLDEFADEVSALGKKYNGDKFMNDLLKVYFHELVELKGRKGNAESQS